MNAHFKGAVEAAFNLVNEIEPSQGVLFFEVEPLGRMCR
jgi:hypothetical protein